MTGFIIKIIALITMVFDHIRYAVPITDGFVTEYLGRLSFPLFAFLITEGVSHTKSRKKYFLRMLIFALISQIPFMMFRTLVSDKFLLNIMFTFLVAISVIYIFDYFRKSDIPKILKYFISFVTLLLGVLAGTLIPVDYGWFGVTTVLFLYIFRDNKLVRTFAYSILVLIYYFTIYHANLSNINILKLIFTILPAFIILLYNGKEGKKLKYFFYVFYPLHMLIIYGLSLFV